MPFYGWSRDATLSRIRGKLDQVLRDHGFSTSQDLEDKVQEILTGKELEKYNHLKTLYVCGPTEWGQSLVGIVIGMYDIR